ncbi:EamA family transporter [Natrarchaeobius chitinivorans]|uniref:Multidrug transporter n=1 Tax=Natrarchaeobius chitinivorans TaxID=1679083 RepID=A0A3N6M4X6_NATCH|nr:EamA family transporter [Natrarchaeobius chitinivorans]RQG97087.1 multidrug transporter [Natrarchaeobius chitinivorans]
MEYLVWAVVGLLAYSLVAPLASSATQDVPPTPALFLSTAVFLAIAGVVLVVAGTGEWSYVVSRDARYVYVAGVFLTVGILGYTAALEAGPVSVVVPIYGMFIVGSSAIGILFLGESVTATRVAGICCAMIAIYLSAEGA